jgi:type IV fimbrial biogenesis protein FimT
LQNGKSPLTSLLQWKGSKDKGFTILELLLGFSLLAIILCFSLPFTPSLYKKNQLQIITDEIKEAIRFAKMQAILTGDTLILTHLADKKNWSEGIILFVDNPKHQPSSDAKLLHEWRWPSSGVHITWRGFQSKDYLLFTPDITSSTVNGTFIISNLKQQNKLVVNRLGRVRNGAT